MFLDLDHLKDLNDTQGHDVGDLLLQQVAGRLLACMRESDTVCRFGGDEFVVVLGQLGPQPDRAADLARQVAQKVLVTLSDWYSIRDKTVFSASSIGLVLFDGRAATGDELLKRADMAMYKAKGGGRNTFRFFDPEMQAAIDDRSQLEADLRLALERGEMLLHYQPVISNRGQIVSVEALIRWDSPSRGLVRPDFFIPIAEQTGLIVPIGRWVLETVCHQLVSWQSDAVAKSLSIAMNVSAREFHEPGFVEHMTAMLEKTGADANQLKLELTEKLVLNDIDEAVEKMSKLRKLGVRFSLDDFGTGNSSLSYLKRLPLDEIKIDQSFVRDVLSDDNDAAIATTIVTLAHSLKLNVVAEGVESEGQCRFLLDQGCHAFQGYVFGRPLPVSQVSLTSFEKLFEATEPLYLSV